MKEIRIDKGLGNAKVFIRFSNNKEMLLYDGNIYDAVDMVGKILESTKGIICYDKDFKDEWEEMKR